ncbi:MAG: hypothetical protein HZA25_02175 [Candidatus Niyogibacteria bacterium]|nr:hypothetical protein [Candidatus Niyogibacteria bacterium]
MLWMMLPCLLLLGILFFAGGRSFSGGYFAPVLIGAFIAAHIWMMFRGHGEHGRNHGNAEEDRKTAAGSPEIKDASKDEPGHGGCCH